MEDKNDIDWVKLNSQLQKVVSINREDGEVDKGNKRESTYKSAIGGICSEFYASERRRAKAIETKKGDTEEPKKEDGTS